MLIVCFASVTAVGPHVANAEGDSLGINAEAAILLDVKTGKILYQKNPDEVLGVASMSKMMTEYLVLEAIQNKKLVGTRRLRLMNMFINYQPHLISPM